MTYRSCSGASGFFRLRRTILTVCPSSSVCCSKLTGEHRNRPAGQLSDTSRGHGCDEFRAGEPHLPSAHQHGLRSRRAEEETENFGVRDVLPNA